MLSISFDRRAIRAATISLSATAMLAACDTDRAVAPTPTAAIPTAAAPIRSLGNTGTLIIKAVDSQDHLLFAAGFKITNPQMITTLVYDNSATDSDTTKGILQLTGLTPGLYTACEVAAPIGYALPLWNCHGATVYAGATTGMEKFVSERQPIAQGGFSDAAGANVGGGSVAIKDSVGKVLKTVTDNMIDDLDPTVGRISTRIGHEGKFSFCVASAPSGYAVAPGKPDCHTIQAKWGMTYNTGSFLVYPAPSAFWTVQDVWGSYIGLATFKISNGFITNTVVDNGAGDLDPIKGRMLVKLPKAGVFTVCESQAPAGYWPDPNCHTVDATSGLPISAGFFTNMYAQVPSTP